MKKKLLILNIDNDYLKVLIDTASTFGVSKTEIIRYCQIPLSLITENNNERISFNQWTNIVIQLLELLPNKGIGYQFGLNCKPTVHGALGFMLITNSNIGKVLVDLQKYYHMRIHKMDISILNKNNKIIIRVNPLYQLPAHLNESKKEQINKFFLESALIDIINNLQMITNYNLTGVSIHVTWNKEDYHSLYEKRLPVIEFNQDYNQISIDLKCLDLPLIFNSQNAYELAMELVNKEYLLYQDPTDKIILNVKQQLIFKPGEGFPSLTHVANKLKISERTLKRELSLANTTFSALLQSKKFELAKKLINSNRNIQEISDLLGYSHISAFSRAFFGWTGKKPSEYIRESKTPIKSYNLK
ncbi:AraC family transcriptional regulator [Acinetobacter sp. Tr-809]|uniref:AraC family transcriptional regulator n=1 Tax=Acinetobacter sp. Tr-809 TaxID=2608324 RepID=UPI00141E09CD|nr:AraC family transcriptional regulator [Acinetobacter sp. Tr-809]NIE98232.1 AraC family transcriptional regulator [Acinetobacter sp. Tr-809]